MTLVTIQPGASTHSKSFEASSCSESGRNPLPVTEFRSPFSDFQIISPLINVLSELSLMTQYGMNGSIEDADIIVILILSTMRLRSDRIVGSNEPKALAPHNTPCLIPSTFTRDEEVVSLCCLRNQRRHNIEYAFLQLR